MGEKPYHLGCGHPDCSLHGKMSDPHSSFVQVPCRGCQPVRRRASYLTVSQQYSLNVACAPIAKVFGYGLYQVGSSLERKDFRDVDLRCIMPNDEFDKMFFDDPNGKKLRFLNVAVSDWIAARTGLPIDFQFQREAEANKEFTGQRNAVGIT